ncbi:hypothetical protein DPEC_G00149180 [Dallia pectoralis]|uniref:Uncharacterized protein n=1 Tax=Dallia pectoralis TaxID=75939 RepID=A0ACC2GJ83_DALPE|nr:hypothetical protein DPEC_G00149180 [Dallia pectoralis]
MGTRHPSGNGDTPYSLEQSGPRGNTTMNWSVGVPLSERKRESERTGGAAKSDAGPNVGLCSAAPVTVELTPETRDPGTGPAGSTLGAVPEVGTCFLAPPASFVL